MVDSVGEITSLLIAAQDGDTQASDRVMALVYEDLCRIASRRIREKTRHGRPPTLQPAELVNEAYLRLVRQRKQYDNRGHFFAIASRVMLRVLLDRHRAKQREKREGEWVRVSLSGVQGQLDDGPSADIFSFVQALERLETLDPRSADVTKLRLLWGLTMPEIAEALNVSVSTVEREWRFAQRWFMAELDISE